MKRKSTGKKMVLRLIKKKSPNTNTPAPPKGRFSTKLRRQPRKQQRKREAQERRKKTKKRYKSKEAKGGLSRSDLQRRYWSGWHAMMRFHRSVFLQSREAVPKRERRGTNGDGDLKLKAQAGHSSSTVTGEAAKRAGFNYGTAKIAMQQ